MYDVLTIANYFLSRIDVELGDSITPLKLQKLIYYSQAWHYTFHTEKLFTNKIEAWAHGPVVREIWDVFKGNMGDHRLLTIDANNYEFDLSIIDTETKEFLDEVYNIYGEHSGTYLEKKTHSEAPWKNARGNLAPHEKSQNEITVEAMKEFYSELLDEQA